MLRVGQPELRHVAILFRDITREKQAFDDLRASEEALRVSEAAHQAARRDAERANRSKDEFVAMLGHELRTPLAPMRTALELMRMRGEASREQEVLERQVTHLGGGRHAGSLRLVVKDEGVGIAPDMLEAVFETFVQQPHTSDRTQGGLGLGLAIVRSLVRAHGGTVRANSEGPNRGSEFIIDLPDCGVRRMRPPD